MVDDWDTTVASLHNEIDEVELPRRAYLVMVRGNNIGETFPIIGAELVIGRAAGADLRLNDEGVSRFHCRIRAEGSEILVEDLSSRNGTFINGERIAQGARSLAEGDRLQIGTTSVLRFTYADVADRTTPTPVEEGMHDSLTGTFTRRYFVECIDREVSIAQNRKAPLSILLIHIDRFSELGQTRPPYFNDELTIGVTKHIRDRVRKHDLIARIAVGQVAIMMLGTSPGDTFMQAQRLRASAATMEIPTSDGPQQVTFSIGVATLDDVRIATAHDFLVAAGSALQRARSQGGNRVVVCTQELLQEPKGWTKV